MRQSTSRIESVKIWRVELPLRQPYHLSFGSVHAFESIFLQVNSDGGTGWGESTPLPGYSDEKADDVWQFLTTHSRDLPGCQLDEALRRAQGAAGPHFASAPLVVALGELQWLRSGDPNGESYWQVSEGQEVPLVGLVGSQDAAEAIRNALHARDQGFETIKMKVAIPPVDVDRDVSLCLEVRAAIGNAIRIRVDANKGYTFEQARRFIDKVQSAGLELLEQPLPIDQWDEMRLLYARRGAVPLMLDESIVSADDLRRCVSLPCADIIKLKLMKQGSLSSTLTLAKQAKEMGMGVVIGNGVQADLGCMQEARLHFLIDPTRAGEENGFLKPKVSMLQHPILMCRGRMRIGSIRVDTGFLGRHATDTREYLC